MNLQAHAVPDRSWHQPLQAAYSVVAIAASAGAFPTYCQILAGLPADFPLPVLLVQHRSAGHDEQLLDLLSRRTRLSVRAIREGERLQPATVHVAMGGRHVTVDKTGALLLGGSRTYGQPCPSCDGLFRSIADSYGAGAIAVVLSGDGRDAALGAAAIRRSGGFVIAQEPRSSPFDGMPCSAVETRKVDLVLPPDEIAFALIELTAFAAA